MIPKEKNAEDYNYSRECCYNINEGLQFISSFTNLDTFLDLRIIYLERNYGSLADSKYSPFGLKLLLFFYFSGIELSTFVKNIV